MRSLPKVRGDYMDPPTKIGASKPFMRKEPPGGNLNMLQCQSRKLFRPNLTVVHSLAML